MNIKEARLYLEHTSKDDFNLEEWQKENRYKAIQVVLQEIERLKEENNFLKLNNPQMNLEHFRVVKENKRKMDNLRQVNKRLNNIINELKWKPINEYENPKYDWVLVKMFFKCDNFECIPRVAEKRFNHWYDANGYEIDEDMFEIKYFMDMQQIDKLYGLKGEYKKEVIKSERRIKNCF